jgi:hypothetical protein
MIGDDLDVELFVKNNSKAKRTIDVAMVTKVSFYTGITAKDLKDTREKLTLGGGEGKSIAD